MVTLGPGRYGFFVAVVGAGACDFTWDIHERTAAARRGPFTAWRGDVASFRFHGLPFPALGGEASFLLHAADDAATEVSSRADVVVTIGDTADHALPVVRAEAHASSFEAWKAAAKQALQGARVPAMAMEEMPDEADVVAWLLDRGAGVHALDACSFGLRTAHAAAWVDSEIKNGGLAQLLWNAAASGRNELVGAGADALAGLELQDASDAIDRALVHLTEDHAMASRLYALVERGVDGFVEFRAQIDLMPLTRAYFAAANGVPAQLVRDYPEYFADESRTDSALLSRST